MPSRAAAIALVALSPACAAPRAEPPRALEIPVLGGSAPANPLPAEAPPPGVVTASLLSAQGEYWGNVVEPSTPPEALIRPCYDEALRASPVAGGWATVVVDVRAHSARREAGSLPTALGECVVRALAKLTLRDAWDLDHVSVYVSLKPR